jgi:hypothetical protein
MGDSCRTTCGLIVGIGRGRVDDLWRAFYAIRPTALSGVLEDVQRGKRKDRQGGCDGQGP